MLVQRNLVLDRLIIPKLIYFFILTTCLLDIAFILLGEILSWSLMGVKGLMWVKELSASKPLTAQPT